MTELTLYFATNRGHQGDDRWHPTGYGKGFSNDGQENLRFGKVRVTADPNRVADLLAADSGFGPGHGEKLAGYLSRCSRDNGRIEAFAERLDPTRWDQDQLAEAQSAATAVNPAVDPDGAPKFGSLAAFGELQQAMADSNDVLIYAHGFNVDWNEAVGAALALQQMLNRDGADQTGKRVMVVLFSWPSDGSAFPFRAYASDRADARGSGKAVGRGLLKVRDFLLAAHKAHRQHGADLCQQELHLLCHSMGNYLLQNALGRMIRFNTGTRLPRMFGNIFMCAPDVDADVLEPGQPMERLPELAWTVNIYHNRGDAALVVSDATKGHPDRLGHNGSAHPALLPDKVHQIDCSDIVGGWVEHSYYLSGRINQDIRQTIADLPFDHPDRHRTPTPGGGTNRWKMT